MIEARTEVSLLIAFVDLTRFAVQSQRTADADLADLCDEFYTTVGSAVAAAGGAVVKFMGDAALIVFPEDRVDRGVQSLLDLKQTVDRLMKERGWDCRLTARVNFGAVIAGAFGPPEAKRYDVIGKAVNVAAMLDRGGVSLSVVAFRKLGPAMRAHFKKHTPPVTYIRAEDPHRVTAGKLDRVLRSAEPFN